MPESIADLLTGKAAPQTQAPASSAKPAVPEAVTYRRFGDAAAMRRAVFDDVLSALGRKYPVANDRYTLQLTDVRYRRPREFSNKEQKRAVMQGRTLGWNVVGRWQLVDNATGRTVDRTPVRLIAKVPYFTDRGTIIYNGVEYGVSNQLRLRPGVYSRVKDNGVIEAHFNVKSGTGPSFRIYMEPKTGIFRAEVGQAKLKLYPLLRAMGYTDRRLERAWGRDLLHTNVAAMDPRAVQRAYTKLVPRDRREPEESLTKAAAVYSKTDVGYVPYGLLQRCIQCRFFSSPYRCRQVQGPISPTGWCVLWTSVFSKRAMTEDANRTRVRFVGTIVCDDSKPGRPWVYLRIHRGLAEAAYEALAEQGLKVRKRLEHPHVTVVKNDEAKALIRKYGTKWKRACGDGRRVRFSLQNALVDLDPAGWPKMDRVWFLELRSPQLRAYRGSLGLPELPQGENGDQPFHITIAVRPGKRKRPTLDDAVEQAEEKTKAAWQTLETLIKLAHAYLRGGDRAVRLGVEGSYAKSAEHEAKCHRCGDCCHFKVAAAGRIYTSGVACPFLDRSSNLCRVYEHRFEVNPYCSPIEDLVKRGLAPAHCGYVGKDYEPILGDGSAPSGLIDRLVAEMGRQVLDRHVKQGRARLPVDLVENPEPKRDGYLAKLAAVLDLSDPIEELADSPGELLARQETAAKTVRDNPAVRAARTRIEREKERRGRPVRKELQALLDRIRSRPKPADDAGDVKTAYEAFVPRFERHTLLFIKRAAVTDYGSKIREVIERMELDEDTTEGTLGRRVKTVSPDLLVDVTKKLIAINRGEAETDDRDSLAYQRVMGPEDLFAERILRDGGGVARRLLWKSTFKGGVQHIPPGALSPQLRLVLLKSGLASPLQETNPFEIHDQQMRVVRTGEGGMSNRDAIPEDSRGVQPSHFGMIDPICSVECYSADTEVMTATGWKFWPDVTEDDRFACLIDGRLEFHRPERIICENYSGVMHGVHATRVDYLVTPNHRMYVRPQHRLKSGNYADWRFELAEDTAKVYGRNLLSGIHHQVYRYIRKSEQYTKQYIGKVYCATVPGGLLYVRRNNKTGFWCGNSEKIGVDTRLARRTYKGSDGQIYTDMTDATTGEPVKVSARRAARSVIAFPGELASDRPRVRAMINSRKLGYVDRDQVDYELPHTSHMFTTMSNLVPLLSAAKGGRLLMATKMLQQALPLKEPEAPLVQNLSDDGKRSFEEVYGKKVGAVRAADTGVVEEITRDHVKVRYPTGRVKHALYHQFPFQQRTYVHNTPVVAVGETVRPGQLLAKSNYTNDRGETAMGRNLRIGYLAWKGYNADDAIVISESASKKLASEHLVTTKYRKGDTHEVGKRAFLSLYPGEFDRRQLATVTDDGIVKPGTVVRQGDPLVLAVDKRKPRGWGLLRGRKSMYSSAAETWDRSSPGVVTDVERTKDGWKVFVRSYMPARVADKLCSRYGSKGVISKVVPDDQMPRDAKGRPLEITFSPQTVITRGNPAQLIEAALGKAAEQDRRPFKVPAFLDESYVDYAKRELQRRGLSDTEDLVDPETGRKIPKVFTGRAYIIRLHHLAEPKMKGRDVGAYTAEGVPAGGGKEGSKRMGLGGELNALLAHGADRLIRDIKVIRGQRNDDYWRALRLGMPLPSPKVPPVYGKFMAYLQGAGINLSKQGDVTHLFALTDRDVDELSAGALSSPETVKSDSLRPIEGGLFDIGKTGGTAGTRWSHIALSEPMPNPVMEDVIRRLLDLTKKEFMDTLAGRHRIGGETGTRGLLHALERIKVGPAIERYTGLVRGKRGNARDRAVKVLGYLRALEKANLKPADLMITKVPVIPPVFRPITAFNKVRVVSDPNYLYAGLMTANRDLEDLRKELGEDNVGDERLQLYKAHKALVGLGDPIAVKTKQTKVRGLIKHLIGDSPKLGLIQRRVVGAAVDLVGRGVITPNPSLNMDQVGLPESKAWVLYRPFLMRRLVRNGMGAMAAAHAIENRAIVARRALAEEMARRPVVINRAPVLHKYGVMAAWPVLSKGETLQIPPVVASGYNADFDGNCLIGISKIVLTFARQDDELLSIDDIERSYRMSFEGAARVVAVTEEGTAVEMEIRDVPYLSKTRRRDRNGASVYDTPPGLAVLTYDHERKRIGMSPATSLTIETTETVRVKTQRGREVVASANESLCVYDHDTGRLVKCCPGNALHRLVPVAIRTPCYGDEGDFEYGWMLGAFVSDGFFSGKTVVGYAEPDDGLRDRFYRAACAASGRPLKRNTYRGVPGADKPGPSARDHYVGATELYNICACCCAGKPGPGERSALYRTLPPLERLSHDALLGILAGLLDGNGSISASHGRKKPQVMTNYSTSSQYLVASVQDLCRRLGVRVKATVYGPEPGRLQKHPAHILTFSTVDLQRIGPRLRLSSPAKAAALAQLCAQPGLEDDRDLVPVPARVMDLCAGIKCPDGISRRVAAATRSRTKPYYGLSRAAARRWLDCLKGRRMKGLDGWRKLVCNTDIHWDIVIEVQPAGEQRVYDLCVPATGVFATNDGLIVQDTMNFQLPADEGAVRDAVNRMLPSRNLCSAADFGVHYYPRQEFLHGLYLASTVRSRRSHVFRDKASALAAWKRGEIDIGDQVNIAD